MTTMSEFTSPLLKVAAGVSPGMTISATTVFEPQ
jgi:hypothetical protein